MELKVDIFLFSGHCQHGEGNDVEARSKKKNKKIDLLSFLSQNPAPGRHHKKCPLRRSTSSTLPLAPLQRARRTKTPE